MAEIRRLLLAIIGVLSGAWLGLDALRGGLKKTTSAANAAVAPAGAKGGTIALPQPALRPVPGPAPRIERKPLEPTTPPQTKNDKPVSVPGAKSEHTDARKIHGPFGFLIEVFKRYGSDHCPAWAASLSFFSILSLIPAMLCVVAIVGFLIQDPQRVQEQVTIFAKSLVPGGTASAVDRVLEQIDIAKRAQDLRRISGPAGIIGFLSLVWASMQIFVNASTPMNAAFRTDETRGWVKLRLVALGLLLATGVLFLLSFVPTVGPKFLSAHVPALGLPATPGPVAGFLLNAFFFLLAIAFNAGMFTLIYRFLPSPSAGVDWKEAAVAGGIVAVLWEAAKQGFAFYLRQVGTAGYDKTYGSLGGVILVVLWIYYSSMILLMGTEIAKLYSDVRDARGET